MNNSDILYDFAEGNFDETVETELFFEMASNSQLRTEFKNILSVNTALNSNRGLFGVPEKSTEAVFSTIGIAMASSAVNNANVISAGVGISNKKYFSSLIATIIVTALITLFITDYFNLRDGGYYSSQASLFNNQTYNKLSNYFAENAEDAVELNDIYSVVAESNNKQNKMSAPELKPAIHNLITDISESERIQNDEFKTIVNYDSGLQILDVVDINLMGNSNSFDKTNLADLSEKLLNNTVENESFWNKFNIEIKNTQDWMLPSPTTTPAKFAAFHNLSLALYYEFNRNLSSGIEVRRETFFQKFDFRDDNNLLTIIEQQPNFTTVYLTGKYSHNLDDVISPYIQLSAGANQVGVVGKLSAGVNYNLTNDFGILLGVENANMVYGFKGNTFYSSKIGFLWGLNFKF